jgi:hypothetical protein
MTVVPDVRNKVGLLVIAKETTRGCDSSLVVIIPLVCCAQVLNQTSETQLPSILSCLDT